MSCLGEKTKNLFVKVLLLDDTDLQFEIKSSSKGQVVLVRVLEHLNLLEKDYFGLRYVDQTNQTHWLDVAKSIGSQLRGQQSILFYFGVKFYAADPTKLNEEITRYQFFLQVKKDVLQGRLPVSFELGAELSALAIQSELGDYDPKRHTYGYVSEFRFLPHQTEELEDNVADLHSTIVGLVPCQAEYKYLDKVKWLDMYGVDLHPVIGDGNMEYFLGLTPTGIVVYKHQNKVGNYFWPRITKITFKGKMFTIRVRDKNNDEHSYGFSSNSKDGCKHLWKCCLEHHAFFRGRTERQVLTDSQRREPPHVHRSSSKRYERRKSPHVIPPDAAPTMSNHTAVSVSKAVPLDAGDVHLENIPPPASSRDVSSAPWTDNNANKGLYTTGRDSPLSVRSEKMKFPVPRRMPSGSDSEAVYRRRHQNRRGMGSDCESDSSYNHKRHRRRRSRGVESGSESECGNRNRHRRRGKSSDNYPPDPQWLPQDGVLKELRSNGSLNSNQNSESSQKRRRRRSRSPGKKPPEELAQHFKYVEPSGFTEDQLKEIPYTSVETNVEPIKVKYSPHSRHRHRSPKRRSYGKPEEKFLSGTPSPYPPEGAEDRFVTGTPSSYPHESVVTPIVGIKEISHHYSTRSKTDMGNTSQPDYGIRHDEVTTWQGNHGHDDSGVGVEQENRLEDPNKRAMVYNKHDSALPEVGYSHVTSPYYGNHGYSHSAFSQVVTGRESDNTLDPAYIPTQPVPSYRYVTAPQINQQAQSMSFNPFYTPGQERLQGSISSQYSQGRVARSPYSSVAPPHRDMMTEL